jgi:hypothetical protein
MHQHDRDEDEESEDTEEIDTKEDPVHTGELGYAEYTIFDSFRK